MEYWRRDIKVSVTLVKELGTNPFLLSYYYLCKNLNWSYEQNEIFTHRGVIKSFIQTCDGSKQVFGPFPLTASEPSKFTLTGSFGGRPIGKQIITAPKNTNMLVLQ